MNAYKPQAALLAEQIHRHVKANPWQDHNAFVAAMTKLLESPLAVFEATVRLSEHEVIAADHASRTAAMQSELQAARVERDGLAKANLELLDRPALAVAERVDAAPVTRRPVPVTQHLSVNRQPIEPMQAAE